MDDGSLPLGLLAGGMSDGAINLWNPLSILQYVLRLFSKYSRLNSVGFFGRATAGRVFVLKLVMDVLPNNLIALFCANPIVFNPVVLSWMF